MNNLQKNFVLQLGSLVALYVSVTAFLTLIFSTINIAIPDPAAGSWEWDSNQSSLRFSLALLVVFFPTYLTLTRIVNQSRREADATYAGFTRWLIYLSLLAGGLVMLVDLVVVIMTFLEGEITLRFILKAVSVLAIIGAVFYYYLKDAKGYWQMRPQMSITYGAVAAAVVLGVVGSSLYHLEMPTDARERKLDAEQVMDLQDMQWRIEDYYRSNESLPETVDAVYVNDVPTAPDGREAYAYTVTGDMTYELCATFAMSSQGNTSEIRSVTPLGLEKNYNWDYQAGRWCFEREIDGEYRQ